MKKTIFLVAVPALAFLGALLVASYATGEESGPIEFDDVEKRTHEFIEYERSIELTPEQAAIKQEALGSMPTACCSDTTADVCCCPCNLSVTVWGLSNALIANHGYDAEQVRAKVEEWLEFVNPDGFSGEACYTGGCMRPFHEDGCGGMFVDRIVF